MLNTFYDKYIFTNGLKYVHNNFYLENLPFVILPTSILSALWQDLDEDVVKRVYYSCKNANRSLAHRFDDDFGLKDEKLVDFLLKYYTASGWGLLQVQNIDAPNKRALATVFDNPFLEAANEKMSAAPVSQWGDIPRALFGWEKTAPKKIVFGNPLLRGAFAGIFSHVFRSDVECVEVLEDGSPRSFSKFVIKPPAEFDWNGPETRAQLNPPF